MKQLKLKFSKNPPSGGTLKSFVFIFFNKENQIITKQKHKAYHFSNALHLRNILLKSGDVKNVSKIRIIREKYTT
jgi:hypothetical protein